MCMHVYVHTQTCAYIIHIHSKRRIIWKARTIWLSQIMGCPTWQDHPMDVSFTKTGPGFGSSAALTIQDRDGQPSPDKRMIHGCSPHPSRWLGKNRRESLLYKYLYMLNVSKSAMCQVHLLRSRCRADADPPESWEGKSLDSTPGRNCIGWKCSWGGLTQPQCSRNPPPGSHNSTACPVITELPGTGGCVLTWVQALASKERGSHHGCFSTFARMWVCIMCLCVCVYVCLYSMCACVVCACVVCVYISCISLQLTLCAEYMYMFYVCAC